MRYMLCEGIPELSGDVRVKGRPVIPFSKWSLSNKAVISVSCEGCLHKGWFGPG